MKQALTQHDVSAKRPRPCKDDFKEAVSQLPNWKTTAYTPSEMAEHGVKHASIIWAFVENNDLPKPVSVEMAFRFAERVLPIFEAKYPDDNRPRKAIEAARAWMKDPTDENMDAARDAARDAWAAARAAAGAARDAARAAGAAGAATWNAAWDAWDAAGDAAWDAAWAAARAAGAAGAATWDAERKAHIKIIEDVLREAKQ